MLLATAHPLTDDPALRRRLHALARHWLGSANDADDAVQETWLRTAAGLPVQTDAACEAWLVTVLRHVCIDRWRRQARHQRLLADVGAEQASAGGIDPALLAEQAERVRQTLHHLVAHLSAGDVATVVLAEVFDMSHAELGRLTGRAEAASRQHLRRVLARVRRRAPLPDTQRDEDADCLLALCQWALTWHDPAGLIAVLRTATPQALHALVPSLCTRDSAPNACAGLVQVGDQMGLWFDTGEGQRVYVPLGAAFAEVV